MFGFLTFFKKEVDKKQKIWELLLKNPDGVSVLEFVNFDQCSYRKHISELRKEHREYDIKNIIVVHNGQRKSFYRLVLKPIF